MPALVQPWSARLSRSSRRPPQIHALDEVRERATGLWRREAEEAEYEAAIARLRDASDIVMDEAYLEKLPD